MRELIISEIAQVAGGDMPSDLQSMISNGFSSRETTAGVIGIAAGLLAGSALRYPFGPVAAVGSLAAWYFLSPSDQAAAVVAPVVVSTPISTATPALTLPVFKPKK